MIGIIGAMDVEVNGLVEKMIVNEEITVSSIKYFKGTIQNKDVVIAKCNPGKVNAAICAQTMILKFNPEVIINSGVAGGLSKELGICDVAIATDVVEHDMDTTPLGEPIGFISGIDKVHIPANEKVYKLLEKSAKTLNDTVVKLGTIASGDIFLNDSDIKNKIVKNFNAICGEMEGGSIGHVACANNIPFGVIRVISDNADSESNMDFPEFCALAAKKSIEICEKFIIQYVKNPCHI